MSGILKKYNCVPISKPFKKCVSYDEMTLRKPDGKGHAPPQELKATSSCPPPHAPLLYAPSPSIIQGHGVYLKGHCVHQGRGFSQVCQDAQTAARCRAAVRGPTRELRRGGGKPGGEGPRLPRASAKPCAKAC